MAGVAPPDAVQEWVTAPPAPALRHVVDRYVGYRLLGMPAGLHRGLPSRNMTLIVSVDRPIDVIAQADRSQSPRPYWAILGGLHTSPALIAHDGNQEGVAIQLGPIGFRTLCGMPATEVRNLTVELAEVTGALGNELAHRLQQARGWRERFAACDDVLLRMSGDHIVHPHLRWCWETLLGSGGRISVHELAEHTGYSRQHLRRGFQSEFGLSPKLAARVVRFDRAWHILRSAPPFMSIAQVAAACGYYDQAHLCRDFTELSGCSPTELLRAEAPFVQDRKQVASETERHE